jgi:hemerythrin-like metal-binding protein
MVLFAWDPTKLDVLVEDMNRQHRQIIDAMNRVGDLHDRKADKQAILAALGQLGRVTTEHFQSEEAHMQRIGFPSLAAHQLIHKKLLADYARHVQTYTTGNAPLPDAFFSFLKLWLSSHIQHIDRKYGEHGARATPRRTGT